LKAEMIKFIKKKLNLIDKDKCYHVIVPDDVDRELVDTMKDLGFSEEEIKKFLKIRNINS
tara:strand:+ start:1539 stop:1718 length:180 start_codon:yes stop_codon:yes gene_type:complete